MEFWWTPASSCFSDQTTAPAWRCAQRSDKLDIGFRSFGSRRSGRRLIIPGSARSPCISARRIQACPSTLPSLRTLLRSRSYDYLVPIDDLACELIYSDYRTISSLTRVIGPDPASYVVAHNNFDALAVAESIGMARPVTHLVKWGEAPPAPLLPCFVRPVVSCAIRDDDWQRFTVRKVNTIEELDPKLRDNLPRVDVMLQVPASGASSA